MRRSYSDVIDAEYDLLFHCPLVDDYQEKIIGMSVTPSSLASPYLDATYGMHVTVSNSGYNTLSFNVTDSGFVQAMNNRQEFAITCNMGPYTYLREFAGLCDVRNSSGGLCLSARWYKGQVTPPRDLQSYIYSLAVRRNDGKMDSKTYYDGGIMHSEVFGSQLTGNRFTVNIGVCWSAGNGYTGFIKDVKIWAKRT